MARQTLGTRLNPRYLAAFIILGAAVAALTVLSIYLLRQNAGLNSQIQVLNGRIDSASQQVDIANAKSRVLAGSIMNYTSSQNPLDPSTIPGVLTYCDDAYPLAASSSSSRPFTWQQLPDPQSSPNFQKQRNCLYDLIATHISEEATNSSDGTLWADDFLDGIVSKINPDGGN